MPVSALVGDPPVRKDYCTKKIPFMRQEKQKDRDATTKINKLKTTLN